MRLDFYTYGVRERWARREWPNAHYNENACHFHWERSDIKSSPRSKFIRTWCFFINKFFIFFKDMCLEKYSLEVREFGQDQRARTNSARANEPHKRQSKTVVFDWERSDIKSSPRSKFIRTWCLFYEIFSSA